jgi:hypothetical protein
MVQPHVASGQIGLSCIEGVIGSATPDVRAPIHLVAGQPHALLAWSDASARVTICLVAASWLPDRPG